ncbi:hypothetical protein ACFY1U_12865 [Streptomyces sp. NPDC001351]|uniref:hypothetical protein n=1 Tax=Streptomyces sp. NPDC001351 TaxID=3364564 RepID=UPI003682FC8D
MIVSGTLELVAAGVGIALAAGAARGIAGDPRINAVVRASRPHPPEACGRMRRGE